MDATERLVKKLENARKERRQSRKESRVKLVNSKRNIEFQETKKVEPILTEAEKLKLWRIEKKKKMDQEKLRRRPAFKTYINVKHTGLTPFRKTTPLVLNKNRANKLDCPGTSNTDSKKKTEIVKQSAPVRTAKQTKTLPLNTGTTVRKLENIRITRQTVNKVLPESKTEIVKQSAPVRTAKQTKTMPLNTGTTVRKLENLRITRQTVNKVLPESVPEVERKVLRILQPSNNPVKSTKKTENEAKAKIKSVKENVPTVTRATKIIPNNNCKDCGKEKQYITRSRKDIKNEKSPEPLVEPSNGLEFQRTRLEEETRKLQELKDIWLLNNTNSVPKEMQDEILSVTGQTTLLITSKFEQFRSLINEYATLLTNNTHGQKKITIDDLDGFWEMMYLQVVQLHNKYTNLEKLMLNNWEDPDIKRSIAKKPVVKTHFPKKSGQSRFKDFLAKQKIYNQSIVASSNSLSDGTSGERITTASNNLFNTNEDTDDDEDLNLELLKKYKVTPKAVKNWKTARKSRRSSMNVIMSMSGVGKFDITGTASPKPEKAEF